MATTQQVISQVQTVLENSIDDPNNDRSSRSNHPWIKTIPIEFGIAEYPRIHIENVSAVHEGLSVGSTERFVENRFQISVFHSVEQGYRLDVDGDDELESQNRVADYLAKKVVENVNDNQSSFRSLDQNIYSVLSVDEQRIQDEQNNVIQHTIDFLIKMRR